MSDAEGVGRASASGNGVSPCAGVGAADVVAAAVLEGPIYNQRLYNV